MKSNRTIFLLVILGCSCRSAVKEESPGSLPVVPLQIRVKETLLPGDSIRLIGPVAVKKSGRVTAANPSITQAFTNISPAGKPTIIKAGIPDTIFPGINKPGFAESRTAEIRKKPALHRRLTKALAPGIINGTNNRFEYLDIEQGLASGNILTVFEDKSGSIWLGTNGEGVIKYDGINFLQFTDKEGLPNNWVRCILEDRKGNLWFGTDGGIAEYDGADFYQVTEKNAVKGDLTRLDTRSMAEDNKGNIWIGTANAGLFRFDGKNLFGYRAGNTPGGMITGIFFDKNECLWFTGPQAALSCFNGRFIIKYGAAQGLIDNNINCLTPGEDGSLWIGTEKGVSRFYNNSFYNLTEQQGLCSNNISTITRDEWGNLWFGSGFSGCCRYDGQTFTHYNLAEGLRSNYVGSILQDNAGNIILGTRGGGITILKRNNFLTFGRQSVINQTNITAIGEDNAGNTWMGTSNGTILKFDGHYFFEFAGEAGLNGAPVNSILKDKNGHMWFGGLRGGICRFDGTVFTRYTDKENPLLSQITELYEDRSGNIWVGTNTNKILKFDGTTITGFSPGHPGKKDVIWSILQDRSGETWFGTHNGRLVNYDGRAFRYYQLKNYPLYNLLQDSAGNIWMASSTEGLMKLDATLNSKNGKEKTFLNVNKISGQYNLRINSLAKDNRDNLWIGTNKGLVWFENPSGQNGQQGRMVDITQKDGLPGEAFVRTSVFMDGGNRLWWGTTKGLCMLDLAKMQLDSFTPNIHLSHLGINGKFPDFHHLKDSGLAASLPGDFTGISYTSAEKFRNYPVNARFPYSLNHLTFHFTAIDWASPQRLKYSYTIDGLEQGWSEPTEDTYADYRNLPYGQYTFRVKAIGAAQKWSAEFVYPFTILPPWWHTWWFRGLVFFVFVLAIYALVRYRTASLLKRQLFLQQTIEKRTEELRSALTDKEALLKEIHHRVKNNLEVISSLLMLQTKSVTDEKAKAGLIEGQSRVQSIALIHHKLYRTDEMGSVEVAGFSKELFMQIKDVFNAPGTRVDFNINEGEVWLNTDAAVPFGLIFNELITNAFKYGVDAARDNIFTMRATAEEEGNTTRYHFVFRDNGPGLPENFKAEKTTSLGMKVIRLLTKQLDGSSEFYNDNGTVFELKFAKNNFGA